VTEAIAMIARSARHFLNLPLSHMNCVL